MSNPTSNSSLDFGDISDAGERVTHLYPNDCYFAHLSIYRFALQYAKNKLVLDAGAGAGYGTAYLADNGIRFAWGIDISSKAIAFSQCHFQRPNLEYKVMDLQKIFGFPDNYFDMIFSSNTLEHVPNVSLFMRHAWQLLKPDGFMVIAAPPIINKESREWNVANRYHLNIWSPRQWCHVLKQFFLEVECYRHHFEKPSAALDFSNTPEQTFITEKDFLFLPVSLEGLYESGSITAIFVAHKPCSKDNLPSPNNVISFVDDSFTRPPDSSMYSPDSLVLPEELSSPLTFWQLLQIGWSFGRQHGLTALMKKTCNFIFKRVRIKIFTVINYIDKIAQKGKLK